MRRRCKKGIRTIDWNEHLPPLGTVAMDFSASRWPITHSQFGALKVKDAVVDQFHERFGVRPSVDLERPSIRINVYVDQDQAAVSIDLAGQSLHRRGYRNERVEAPLKENLAAAILLCAGWPMLATAGKSLLRPMCGPGMLPSEALLMVGGVAPGLTRDYFHFLDWRQHDAAQWTALIEETHARRQPGLKGVPR
jgi:23S rRNA (guanine2445-N2)-methyltransferase / 23S rRNA (guanine2069-N7)-methyltransferase